MRKRFLTTIILNAIILTVLLLPFFVANNLDSTEVRYFSIAISIIVTINTQIILFFLNNKFGKLKIVGDLKPTFNKREVQFNDLRIKALYSDCILESFTYRNNKKEITEFSIGDLDLVNKSITIQKEKEIDIPIRIKFRSERVRNYIKLKYKYKDIDRSKVRSKRIKLRINET